MGDRNRQVSGRKRGIAFLVGAMLVTFPVLLYAHLALVESAPAADSRLDAVPAEVLLTFTQEVEVSLSTIVLTGPQGDVALGPLETNDGRTILRAPIVGTLAGGDYGVQWQAVGPDGHPVRGEYTFTIGEGAAGLPPPVVEAPPEPPVEAATPPVQLPTFSAGSPLYVGVRWINYLGILGTTGAVGFILLLMGLSRDGETGVGQEGDAIPSAAVFGMMAAVVALLSLPLRLQAQSHAVFGQGIDGERFGLLMTSAWGTGWTVQAAGAVAALVGFILLRRAPAAGLALAAVGAFGMSLSPGLSGHAAAVDRFAIPAMVADGLHVLAAGVWIGTLLALVVVGIPLVRRRSEGERGRLLSRMLAAFSPIALGSAVVLAATGAFASLLHLGAVADLWQTGYGRVLTAKLLLVAMVAAAGAYNWRRLRPRSHEPGAEAQLRRSAGFELAAAALVVALTAVLVAVPPPAEAAALQAEASLSAPEP